MRLPLLKRLFSVREIHQLGPQKNLCWNINGKFIPANSLLTKESKKTSAFTYAFAAIFTLFCVTGFALVNGLSSNGESRLLSLVYLLILFGAISLSIAFFLRNEGLHILLAIQQKTSDIATRITPSRFARFAKKREMTALFVILVVLWIPYLIAFFPGIFMYDSTWQLFQTQGSGALPMGRAYPVETAAAFTDHKPLFHTLLIGILFDAGKALGSQTLGIFLITLFQYVAMALAFAYLLKECYAITKLRGVQIIGLAFFGLFPFFPMYAVSPFNDCLAAAAFTVWATMFVETVRTKGGNLTPRTTALFLFWGIISTLMKKPNVYIIVLCSIILAIAIRKKVASVVAQGLVPAFISFLILPACIYPLLSVAPGDKGEMLGTFFQQTVTFAKVNESAISDADKAAIDKMLYFDEALGAYDRTTFDWAKYYYKNTETTSDLIDYMTVWAKQGLQDPLSYTSAFAHIQYPWVYPSQSIDFYTIDYEGMRNEIATSKAEATNGLSLQVRDSLDYRAPECLQETRTAILNFLYRIEATPGINLLFSVALYATWIPLALTLVSATSRKRILSLVALSPMYVSMAILFISPIVMSRYALPVFALIPLALAVSLNGIAEGDK